jgi:hypothetical protein
MPADPAGVRALLSVLPPDGGSACIYTYFRLLNDLFVAEGSG